MAIKQSNYPNSRSSTSVAKGLAFERFIAAEFHRRGWIYTPCMTSVDQWTYGDAKEGIEVKFNDKCSMLGSLSIEIAERTALSRPWFPSGIYADSRARIFVIGNYHVAYVFRRDDLRNYYESERPATIDDNPKTIRKFYLALRDAKTLSIAVIVPREPWGRDEKGNWKELTGYGHTPKDR